MTAERPDAQTPRAAPRATYRLQLHAGFPFAAAADLAPYLATLGISHVYLSPILQAAPRSTHGYDVVDHGRVSDDLGGGAGFDALGAALGKSGLGQVVDIVPNHMAIAPENPWWWDVLENGPSSREAGRFDVDWDHPEAHLRNRILVPVLADHYGRVLEAGEIRLAWEDDRFVIRYHEHRLPVAPRSLEDLLARAAARAGSDELAYLADAFAGLPPSSLTDRASVERRHRDKEVLRARLAELVAMSQPVAEAVDAVVAATTADPDELDRLLERQNFRLAWWRSARRDLGYRRFFDVTTLTGLRVEDDWVFEDTHRLVLRWLAGGVIDGVRIDHPDGLRDPEGYFRRLQWASPRAWIVAEKILEHGEELRRSWPIAGTTGYDFLDRVQRLFLDPDGEAPLTALHDRFCGDAGSYPEIVRDSKLYVLREVLGSELNRLTGLLLDVLEAHRRHRDHTRHDLHEALRALLLAMPVYRTYVRPADDGAAGHVAPEDEAVVGLAIAAAKVTRPDLPADLFDVIADLLLLRLAGPLESEFVVRFQQLSGPVMAKGVEDTALYRYLRLVALNDVGGDPGRWSLPARGELDAFDRASAATQERWPETMLTTSTHDTKRSEDVRARLLVLAEVPERWAEAVGRWSDSAAEHGVNVPDGHAQYLVFQTLVGAWPIDADRLSAYLVKALREAKLRTSWSQPDPAYEASVTAFATRFIDDSELCAAVAAFVGSILVAGRVNSLSQTLIKLTAPGIPDLYQGTELWDLSLVDPDNRRPVDVRLRRRLLTSLEALGASAPDELTRRLADPADEGLPKLWLIQRALGLRARRSEDFGRTGSYRPLRASGERADHVVGFGRGDGVVVVLPRLTVRLAEAGGWGDTALSLPTGPWTNVLTGDPVAGGVVPVASLLARFPVALLEHSR